KWSPWRRSACAIRSISTMSTPIRRSRILESGSRGSGSDAVETVHDLDQVANAGELEVRAGVRRVEGVAVAREGGAHADAARPDDVAIGPVADHDRFLRRRADQ